MIAEVALTGYNFTSSVEVRSSGNRSWIVLGGEPMGTVTFGSLFPVCAASAVLPHSFLRLV